MSLNNEGRSRRDCDILTLPCPGQSINRDDRQFKTFELKIKPPPKVAELKNHLASFGLTKSGKQAELIERLRKFSENPEEWNSILLPARGRQRGDISKRTAAKDFTAARTLEVFGARETELTFQPKKGGYETRPIVQMSEHREAANDAWATAVLRKRTAQTDTVAQALEGNTSPDAVTVTAPSEETQANVGSADREHQSKTVVLPKAIRRIERQMVTINRELHSQFGAMRSQMSHLETMVSSGRYTGGFSFSHAPGHPASVLNSISSHLAYPPSSSLVGVPGAISTTLNGGFDVSLVVPPQVPPTNTCRAVATSHSPQPLVPSRITIPREGIPPGNLLIFDLDGEELAFDRTQVPSPPKVSFANDLPRLFLEWHDSNLLTVNGRGIPIKHWERFYKKRVGIKQHAWDLVRVKWGNWRFLVLERERFDSEDAFWAKYTDEEGKHLNFQKILDALQGGRKTDDNRDAAAALWFFGGDLTHPDAHGRFSYKKDGKSYVCKKNQAIAVKWRKLLCDYEDVAQQWELVRPLCPQHEPDDLDPQLEFDA